MGIPFNNLVCASNKNNVLTEFFHTGSYDIATRRLQQTISPSIDILKSSNLERLIYHAFGSGTVVANLMRSLEENKIFKVSSGLVWENGRHFATSPLVSPWNDVRGASGEIPSDTDVVLRLVVPRGKFASTNQKHSSDLDSDASSVWNFCVESSDVICRGTSCGSAKCRPFSEASKGFISPCDNPVSAPCVLQLVEFL